MNKSRKYYKIIPLLFLLMFLLTGCVSLQDLKDDHAIWADASKKTILCQGKEYVYLTNYLESYFSPKYDPIRFLYVTEPDVPTLLAAYEGDYADISEDGKFICIYDKIFCIKEEAEEMKEYVQEKGALDRYGYEYYSKDDYEELFFHMLTKEESQKLETIIEKSDTTKNYEDYYWVTQMIQCSEDGMFRKYMEMELCITDKGAYILEQYGEEGRYAQYTIPAEYYGIIEDIFADAIEAYEPMDEGVY